MLLGAPTLKLRGDYLAIVTLGFRRDHPRVHEQPGPSGQHHQRPQGHGQIDSLKFFGLDLGKPADRSGFEIASVTLYYYLFLALVVISVVICHRLQHVAHRPRLDGHPRGRDRRQGHGHQHPQHEAAGLWHGRHVRRRVGRDVRQPSRASCRPSPSA
jgi:hypothetical protein